MDCYGKFLIFHDGASLETEIYRWKQLSTAIQIKQGQRRQTKPQYYGYDFAQVPLNISKAELSALKKLSRNKNLIILRPDKGNGVVVLNRIDYINKVESLLSDASKFKKIDIEILDLCLKRENKLIRFLSDNY